eukprot:gnl/MRDRNA2_/MRDRNA2_139326_c0_seq1.p1 gnl/MRDRNA2_/MRDRNA2_139326_c0~~gnl/MRDRNA2_/MRDRNA2_139326_c0_seq1.p1  ORF type:complete len:254 (+),score=24.52 gnl/MRDRNA2_/MRDRNA2_139326_c0_seq1:258-1019(+)
MTPPTEKRQSAIGALLAKMDKFRFGLRRNDASNSQSHVSSGANSRSMGNEPVRWCEKAGTGASNSNHNSAPQGFPEPNHDEVILADFDREDPPNAGSRDSQSDPLGGMDWPNSSSWPSSTPGMANPWPMGNTDSILPGTVNTGDESPDRRNPMLIQRSTAPMTSPLAQPNRSGPSAGGPLAPLTVRPVPAPVPSLVAALPGSITSTPAREHRDPHQPTVCAPSGGPRRNKRIVYSDPVVQWGFRGPAIKSTVR